MVFGENGYAVACCGTAGILKNRGGEQCRANAARLAHCWNSHDALVEACKAAERLSAKVVAVSGLGARHEVVTEAIVVRDAARAAIAKAEGGAA